MTCATEHLAGQPIIIGAGLAGLMTALHLAPQPTVVLTKASLGAEAASGAAVPSDRADTPAPCSGAGAARGWVPALAGPLGRGSPEAPLRPCGACLPAAS